MQFIDLKAQYHRLKPDIDARIARVLDHGQYILGPEVSELEERLADFVGVKHAIGVSDGTTALLIAMMALDIQPGDEIITTPFSFWATAETILLLQAEPVFVDIEPDTYNLDADQVEAAITGRTRAILPVSLYGQCADLTALNQVANKHGLAVVEDAAQSFGATHRGRHSCGLSTIACTSFFPSKPLGCYGDGGACFTDDDYIAGRIKQIRAHGQAKRYQHAMVGVNGRLDTIQAAILLAKLPGFEQEIAARQAVAARYNQGLVGSAASLPVIRPENTSVYAQYTISVPNRDDIVSKLKDQGIPTAVHYPVPMHRQPALAEKPVRHPLARAESAAGTVLSLPMSPDITEADQDRVSSALIRALDLVN